VKPISDVIYRFGQVSIHDRSIDWGSTCGNMVAAAAHWAVGTRTADIRNVLGHLPPAAELQQGDGGTYFAKLRILAHDSGKVVKASVPVEVAVIGRERTHVWSLANKGDCQIAGVPGTAPGIILESPLVGSVLSTGNEKDTIEVDGEQVCSLFFVTREQ
jgi:2-methylaconitate cis-trans-isomerase PrpF